MPHSIYHLDYDFVQHNGNYMVFFQNGGYALQSDDLAGIQVKMMQSNTLPKILPLQVEDIDFNVKLYYNFTGKRMLKQVLREGKLTIEQYYQLLYEIVAVVEKSKEFMFNEQNYILHEDFIFVDSTLTDIYLVYLPLKEISGKQNLAGELKNLAINLMGQIKEIRGEGVQHLITILNGATLNLGHLKAKLDELRKRALVADPSMGTIGPNHSNPDLGKPEPPEDLEKEVKVHKPEYVSEISDSTKKDGGLVKVKVPEKVKKDPEPVTVEEPAKTPPTKTVVISLLVLSFALIYKLYEMLPSEGMIYIASGLGLLAVTVAYYFSFVRILPKKVSVKATSQAGETGKGKGKKAGKTADQEVAQIGPERVPEAIKATESAGDYDKRDYYELLGGKTIMITEENKTVRLVEETMTQPQKNAPYLEINRNNKIEKISIILPKFTIGRNPTSVNYVEDTIGISRMHIEVEGKDGQFFLKDLNSRNGTHLNTEKLVPYKQYVLNNGDQIMIGRIQYTFKIEG